MAIAASGSHSPLTDAVRVGRDRGRVRVRTARRHARDADLTEEAQAPWLIAVRKRRKLREPERVRNRLMLVAVPVATLVEIT